MEQTLALDKVYPEDWLNEKIYPTVTPPVVITGPDLNLNYFWYSRTYRAWYYNTGDYQGYWTHGDNPRWVPT